MRQEVDGKRWHRTDRKTQEQIMRINKNNQKSVDEICIKKGLIKKYYNNIAIHRK